MITLSVADPDGNTLTDFEAVDFDSSNGLFTVTSEDASLSGTEDPYEIQYTLTLTAVSGIDSLSETFYLTLINPCVDSGYL